MIDAPKRKTAQPPASYYPLRLPSDLKQKLTVLVGNETVRRGQRISMNTLILESIEHYLDAKSPSK